MNGSGVVSSLGAHRRRRNGGASRRMLVVLAHPVPESFVAAVAQYAVAAMEGSGHEVRVVDLYAENFDARLSRDEWRTREAASSWTHLNSHVEALRWADGLVFVYPTWFGAQPAILKGWFDRVWGEGIAYSVPPDGRRVRGRLTNIASMTVITTHGSTKFMNSLQGEPGKRVILRGLRSMCGVRCATSWTAFYGNDRATDADRQAFLDRVSTSMSKL